MKRETVALEKPTVCQDSPANFISSSRSRIPELTLTSERWFSSVCYPYSGIPLPFPGYHVGYSDVGNQHKFFTWAILKAHMRNNGVTVRLWSGDPRDNPLINFHSINEPQPAGRSAEGRTCSPSSTA